MDRTKVGATLVDLIVVVGIIVLLIALLLPAVQSTRATARRLECKNHLKQLSLGMLAHHDTHGHFPTNGWGFRWVGDPDAGFGIEQPGGWIYNVLPYVEQQELRELGASADPLDKREALAELLQKPLGLLYCPSRRAVDLYPYTGRFALRNTFWPARTAKSDYAVNAGEPKMDGWQGPASMTAEDLAVYNWPDFTAFNGICFVLSQIKMVDVADGTTHTLMLGEKYVSTTDYFHDTSGGDDQTMYLGDDADIRRWTTGPPLPDSSPKVNKEFFGSAHSDGSNFAFCDGSVRTIDYSINLDTFRRIGNRRDGQNVDPSSF